EVSGPQAGPCRLVDVAELVGRRVRGQHRVEVVAQRAEAGDDLGDLGPQRRHRAILSAPAELVAHRSPQRPPATTSPPPTELVAHRPPQRPPATTSPAADAVRTRG